MSGGYKKCKGIENPIIKMGWERSASDKPRSIWKYNIKMNIKI
jgi:hypothetical protein